MIVAEEVYAAAGKEISRRFTALSKSEVEYIYIQVCV